MGSIMHFQTSLKHNRVSLLHVKLLWVQRPLAHTRGRTGAHLQYFVFYPLVGRESRRIFRSYQVLMKDHEGSHREVSGERAMRGCRACLLVPDASLPSDVVDLNRHSAFFGRLCESQSSPSYMPSPVTAFVAAMCHLIV